MDHLRLVPDPARAEADAALQHASTAAAVAQGAPALVLGAHPLRLVTANAAACVLFSARDPEALASRIAAAADPAISRLVQLNSSLRPGAPGRLERLRCAIDGHVQLVSFMVRRTAGASPLLVAVAPDLIDLVDPTASPTMEARAVSAAEQATAPARSPAPKTLAETTSDLAARFDSAPFVRFLWQTDADNALTSITGQLCDVVGCDNAALVGRDLMAFASERGADPHGRLAAAFARRESWSGVELLWPIIGVPAAVPVVLGGLPSFDRDRRFEGYRGYGVIHIQRLEPYDAPVSLDETDEAVSEPLPTPVAQLAPEPIASPDAPADEAALPSPDPSPEAEATVAAVPANSGNVVPLRPARGFTPTLVPNRPDPSDTIELSPSERNAFREIARALGARVGEADRPVRTPSSDAAMPASAEPSAEKPPSAEPEPAAVVATLARVRDMLDIATEAHGRIDAPAVDATDPEPSEPDPTDVASPRDDGPTRNMEAIVERMPFGVLVSRFEVPIYLNATLLDMLGYADADAFHAAGGLEQMFRGRNPEALAEAAGGGAIPLVTRAGDVIAAEARLQAIDWDGEPATLICLRRSQEPEYTARLRSIEQDLRNRDSEVRELHAILDTATDGVAVLDEQGRILALNRSAEALFGYDQNEVAGESFTTLLVRDSHQVALDYLAGLQTNGVATVMNDGRDVTGRARQGGSIPLFMTLGRVSSGGGHKFCAVMRDMTNWKKAERELDDARRQAERASALKSDFLAKVSHEVRTPLNAILGFAEVIMDERFGPIGNERYKDYLKDIHASGVHVMSLVNDLLDLSKIEAGRLELNFASVDANRIVSECVSLMQPQANRDRVIIRMSLAQRLPNIVADERSLRQIVLNLLSNAVKFNEPGGQVIVSTALTDAGHAVIRIRDTGIGMSETETLTALEPFRQLATARVSGGTGLGLPLTKALVEANRASFTIKSKKKEGTLIEVAFPPTRVLAE